MLKINEISVDHKNLTLIIDISVSGVNESLTSISIATQDGLNTTNPESSTFIYTTSLSGKTARKVLTSASFSQAGVNMERTLFFVLIKTADGTTPSSTLEATLDLAPVYNQILTQIKGMDRTDPLPKGLINYYLEFKALQMAVETEHYQEAVNFFNRFFKEPKLYDLNCEYYGGDCL